MRLNVEALEAAIDHARAKNLFTLDGAIAEGISKYLSASIPAEIGELVERLEKYVSRATQDFDGRDEWFREAASALRALSAELETVRGELERLYDSNAPMADGEVRMTAAEDALAWLLIEKIGVPDDQSYTPDMAQQILASAIDGRNAAEAKLAGGETVKVKPLEWTDSGSVPDGPWSETYLRQARGHHNLGRYAGSYTVQEMEAGGKWGWWNTWTSDREPEGIEDTIDEAKAAAQTDFERRILSALIHPAPAHEDGSGEPVAAFGHGTLIVDTGTAHGQPAVFIRPSPVPGHVGEKTRDEHKGPLDRLVPGEIFMTFPTDEQARRVADALCNASHTSGEVTEAASPVAGRVKVPNGQTPLNDDLGHRLLDVFAEGIVARKNGTSSPYHGHSLEHCLHAAGWVQCDLRMALEAALRGDAS